MAVVQMREQHVSSRDIRVVRAAWGLLRSTSEISVRAEVRVQIQICWYTRVMQTLTFVLGCWRTATARLQLITSVVEHQCVTAY